MNTITTTTPQEFMETLKKNSGFELDVAVITAEEVNAANKVNPTQDAVNKSINDGKLQLK